MGDLRFTQRDEKRLLFSNSLPRSAISPLVIPSSVPGFPATTTYVDQRHGSQQEIRGSVVEGPAVCPFLDLCCGA
jgi:hypothetical protein